MKNIHRIIQLMIFIGFSMVHAPQVLAEQTPDATQASGTKSQYYPNSIALVVGVNQAGGEWAPLASAEDDAERFAQHLRERGFDVTMLLGDTAAKSEILRQLQTELPKKISAEDRFIFYFAGHGQTQVTQKGSKVGYIIPTDGKKENGEDQWHTYLSMRELKDILTQHIDSRHTLLLFDSCFSGMMFTRGGIRRASLGAKAHLKLKGVMALTAGSDQELAVDGLFTPTLIQALSGEADTNQDQVISFQELALYTRQELTARRAEQNPQFGIISGNGQMIFESDPHATREGTLVTPTLDLTSEVPPAESGSSGLGLILSLSGGASLIGGTALLMRSLNRNQRLNKKLLRAETEQEFNSIIDAEFNTISTEYYSGWGLVTIGALITGYGIYRWIGDDSTDQPALSWTPLLAPHSAGLHVTW